MLYLDVNVMANTNEMINWRKKIMSDKIEDICLYCQRRFLDEQEFAFFSSKQKKWIMSYQGDTIIKNLKQIFTDIQVNQSTQPHIHN